MTKTSTKSNTFRGLTYIIVVQPTDDTLSCPVRRKTWIFNLTIKSGFNVNEKPSRQCSNSKNERVTIPLSDLSN